MSYILEALKKSDQQRQRGATPTLLTAQVAMAAPKQPVFLYYGLLAAVLLGAGILIGWLRPWQAEQPAPAAEPIAAKPPISISHQTAPAPLPEPPEMARKTAQELPAPNSTPAVQPAPMAAAMQTGHARTRQNRDAQRAAQSSCLCPGTQPQKHRCRLPTPRRNRE